MGSRGMKRRGSSTDGCGEFCWDVVLVRGKEQPVDTNKEEEMTS